MFARHPTPRRSTAGLQDVQSGLLASASAVRTPVLGGTSPGIPPVGGS